MEVRSTRSDFNSRTVMRVTGELTMATALAGRCRCKVNGWTLYAPWKKPRRALSSLGERAGGVPREETRSITRERQRGRPRSLAANSNSGRGWRRVIRPRVSRKTLISGPQFRPASAGAVLFVGSGYGGGRADSSRIRVSGSAQKNPLPEWTESGLSLRARVRETRNAARLPRIYPSVIKFHPYFAYETVMLRPQNAPQPACRR